MKKHITVLLIILGLSLMVVGCTNTKKEDPKQSNAPIIGDEKQTGKW